MTWRRWLLAAGLAALGCYDPVHEDAVDALGPEEPGVKKGPLHRPGQPCTVCHGGDGPGSPTFSIAGTVFQGPDTDDPLVGGAVRVWDSAGQTIALGTNCAGNFYALEGDFEPTYPIWASVFYDGERVDMESPIFRASACASCHQPEPGPESPGRVFFADDGRTFPRCN